MDAALLLLLLLLFLAIAGWSAAFLAHRKTRATRKKLRSNATRYGTLTEQYAPWLAHWPFPDARRFRFLGDPIDGVAFEPDAVYLVEVKTASGRLTPDQERIRDLVLAGRVGWVTFHVNANQAPRVERPWER